MSITFNPHEYQDRATTWTLDNDFCALWMEMGLGKTAVTLTALEELIYTIQVKKVLIISPLRVANSTWPDEINKWEHTRCLPYSVITGSAKQRLNALKSKAPIHIINFDNIVWLVKHVLSTTGGRWPYDTVVIDESSWIKNQDAKRYKAIAHIRPAVDRMIQLTGSPAANGLLNLWSQIFLLDYGKRLGNTYKSMKDRWFQPVAFNEYGPKWVIRPGASNEIHERVADIALSLRAKDYLDMPDDIVVPVKFDLTPKLREQYDHLEAQMWLELQGKNIEAVNGGALTQKTRQFTNGFLYDEDKIAHHAHHLKMNALKDVVAEAESETIIIGYQYKYDLKRILEAFPQAVQLSDDPQMIHDWNDGLIPILLAHPKSAGHGLNLQEGGHMIVLYGLDWSLELYEQIVARLSRQGQRSWKMNQPVMVYLLMARGTIDELMLMRIEAHAEGQDALKNAVARYQRMRITT